MPSRRIAFVINIALKENKAPTTALPHFVQRYGVINSSLGLCGGQASLLFFIPFFPHLLFLIRIYPFSFSNQPDTIHLLHIHTNIQCLQRAGSWMEGVWLPINPLVSLTYDWFSNPNSTNLRQPKSYRNVNAAILFGCFKHASEFSLFSG